MTVLTIPLDPEVKSFRQRTTLDGTDYVLVFQFNQRLARWFMDVLAEDDTPLMQGKLLAPSISLARLRVWHPSVPQNTLMILDLEAAGVAAEEIVQNSQDASRDDLGDRHALTYVIL